jgi:hypothetical protein
MCYYSILYIFIERGINQTVAIIIKNISFINMPIKRFIKELFWTTSVVLKVIYQLIIWYSENISSCRNNGSTGGQYIDYLHEDFKKDFH